MLENIYPKLNVLAVFLRKKRNKLISFHGPSKINGTLSFDIKL